VGKEFKCKGTDVVIAEAQNANDGYGGSRDDGVSLGELDQALHPESD
jgi:hypothetical protein